MKSRQRFKSSTALWIKEQSPANGKKVLNQRTQHEGGKVMKSLFSAFDISTVYSCEAKTTLSESPVISIYIEK